MNKLKKSIAFILCVTLLSSIPIEAMAKTNVSGQQEQTGSNKISFDAVSGEKEKESLIVDEIEGERTEFTKEFMLADGTKMIAVYDQPVHFKNKENKWVDYDNSLVVKDASTLTNKTGSININLSKTASDQNMLQLSSGNNTIAWGYENAGNSQLKTESEDIKNIGNEKFTNLTDVTSEAMFPEVYNNVDLQYYLSSTGIKENVVLKNSDVQNEFTITYSAPNMTAKQIDDSMISFENKEGDEVYRLAAPYMTDAKGEISTKLTLSLVSQENSSIKVKLTADSDFIKSPNRSFPITIDPEITKNFVGMFVMDEGEGSIKLNHGPYYVSNNHYVITKVNSLPTLGEGEQIISAKFNYDITNGDTLFTSENDAAIIFNAYKITSFNGNVVNRDNTVLDYDSITFNDNEHISFDLTKLVKDWYAGTVPANGFIFEANDTVGSNQVNVKARNNTDLNPSITIVYKDFKGTESGMSYHTFEAGQNATASVSDYLGNLVVDQTLYEGTGSRMPAATSATYNSIGNTWGFSFNQKITAASSAMAALGYDYIYTDKQGTNHYLKKDETENEWYDEDGLGVSLTAGESELTLDNGSKQTYALPVAGGNLLSEKDENNNTITYEYSNGVISKITDGSGREININTNNGVITSIALPGNSNIAFSYSNGLITKVVFPGGRMSRYSYDNGKLVLIEQADNISGSETVNSKLGFTYTGDKVTRVTQYGSDGTEGNYLNFAYGTDNTTVFTDKQGREVTYTFDNSGNRISVLNANGFLENSAVDGLIVTGSADSFTKNYITESIEHSANYYTQFNGSTSSGGSVVLDTQNKYFGSNSVKIVNPVSENNTAFYTGAAHEFDTSQFANGYVTFSAYVKTSDVQEISGDGAIGASISIDCCDSNGTVVSTGSSVGITGTEDWQRLSVSACITSEVNSVKVICKLSNASGSAWFDGMQLEEGSAANDLNVLQNADFSGNGSWFTEEDVTAAIQNGSVNIGGVAGAYDDAETEEEVEETTVEETQPETVCETVYETSPNDSVITYDSYGNQIRYDRGFVTRLVKKTYEVGATEATEATEPETSAPEETTSPVEIDSTDPLGNKYVYQTVDVGRPGMMFNIVGEAKADSVPLTNEYRTFGIAMNIYYDGENTPETHYQEFNSNTNKRQTVSLSVTPNYIEKLIDHIAFAFVYGYNKNTMTAYSAMLNIATVGYPVSEEETTEPSSEPATEEPTDEPFDDYVDYEVLSESVDTSQPYMSSEMTYDASGNYQTIKKDEAGNETEYEYDVNGNITSVVNDNFYVDYTYDSAGNVTSISNDNIASTYTYNGAGDVSAIGHNGFSYTFNYDIYNQLISTAIGNVTIAGRTYSADGFLTKTDFANGDYIEYSYDGYGNLVQLKGENGIIAKFIYNKKGLVAKSEDISGGTVTYYQYDFSGSKTGEYRQAISGDLSYSLGYNSDGNKVEKTSINSQTKTITSGTDSDGNSFVDNDGVRVSSTSDDFGRTAEVITAYGGTDAFTTQYTYRNRPNSSATTNNVHSITQKHGDNTLLQYYYGFDSNGNIIGISETTNLNTSFETYQYDDLNQLEAAVDTKKETYTRIYYDNGGNITQVVKSNYDTFIHQPTTDIYRNTYTYGDSNWKDKLTKFNNQAITYDAMGNPLQYRDGLSFTWENGRRLKTVTNNGTTLTMLYDSNGLRTQKGGVRYYYDSDNNLIAMVKDGNTLFFYYDENGSATSFSLGGNMYFYVKNLQRDIINIVDSSGTVLVRYDYDVFGRITAVKNGNNQTITDTSSLAFINPLRYRGYVYDDETGLYYLQSRYYDPVTGRFLNADVYADTGSGSPLSSNRFCYCENNAINKFDKNGEDACWLQAEKAVKFLWKYMGHTSLLLQEKAGFWWYFYWGPDSIQMLFVPPGSLGSINTNIANQIKYWYNNRYTKTLNLKVYGGISEIEVHKYSKSLHMKGNFVSSVSKIKSMIMSKKGSFDERRLALFRHPSYYYYYKGVRYIRPYSMIFYNNRSSYSVLSRNCKHVSIDYLKYGSLSNSNKNKWFIWWLNVARAIPVPNDAYSYLVGKNIGTVVTV